MQTEIIVAIAGSATSLILGIISIVSTYKISLKQKEIGSKNLQIELLQKRSQKIEEIKKSISTRKLDVSNIKNFEIEFFARLIDCFVINSSEIFSISHLLDENFVKELRQTNEDIGGSFLALKSGSNIDDQKKSLLIQKVALLIDQTYQELDTSLRNIEGLIRDLSVSK
jgi:hypothetical protein